MVLDRLKQVAQHVAGTTPPPHPFDPLSASEIEKTTDIVRKEYGSLFFNAVTVMEPKKADMQPWLANPDHTVRPHRVADVVAIGKGSKVYDGLVDLDEGKILEWNLTEDVQPLVWELSWLYVLTLTFFRLPWRISRSWNTSCGKTPKSSNNADSSGYQKKTCTRSIAIVGTQ